MTINNYRTRASINRSRLVTAPLNFHWKIIFYVFFMSQSQGKNYNFLLLTADNDGVLMVILSILHIWEEWISIDEW